MNGRYVVILNTPDENNARDTVQHYFESYEEAEAHVFTRTTEELGVTFSIYVEVNTFVRAWKPVP